MAHPLHERMMKEDVLAKIVWKLYSAKKPNVKTASTIELLIWALKYFGSRKFIELHNNYHDFLSHATRYFPFSLGWRNTRFHYKNRGIVRLVNEIEEIVRKAGFDIIIVGDNDIGGLYEIHGWFRDKVKDVEKTNSMIQEALMEKYSTIYVRGDGIQIRILIPSDMFEELTAV